MPRVKNPNTELIQFKVTPELCAMIVAAVESQGVTLAAWARRVMHEAAARDVAQAARDKAALAEFQGLKSV